MLEKNSAKWITFNFDEFNSQCCRCYSSGFSINSCIDSSKLKIIKNDIKKPKRKSLRVRSENESTESNQSVLCKKMASIKLNEEKSADISSKFRSVSVDDLENMVKQLIEAALKDDDETIQLEMVVCREEYFRKFKNTKEGNSEPEQTLKISNCKEKKSQETNLESDTSRINNSPKEIKFTKEKLDKKLNGESTFINLIEDFIDSRGPQSKESKNNAKCNKTKKINKSKDLKPTMKKNLRSKLTKNIETDKKVQGILQQETIQGKGDFTFEAWKAAKTRAYKLLLKEEKRKRHQELLENAKKLERERAAHMVYLNWKRDQQKQQKVKRMHVKVANETMIASKIKSDDEKRNANWQAFKEWKKRKDVKIRREKMMSRTYYQQYNQQCSSPPLIQTELRKPKPNIDFDTWLDQVNHVLHQKYLRERRFQVRSFYCQPTYYGTAALI